MGTSSSVPIKKHVVIVGGGFGGVKLAMGLQKADIPFTLIDAKDSFMNNIAAVRAIVQPEICPKLYVNYAETFKDKFKNGKVTSIDPNSSEVVMESGERVHYDILVLSTGRQGPFPGQLWDQSKEEGVRMYTEYAAKLKSVQRIGIIGGGAVGVEIAAEIRTDFKDKQVTLFHPNKDLVAPGLSEKFQAKLRSIAVDRLKCKFVLGEKVTNLAELGDTGPFTLQLTDGSSHEVDLVIKCTGSRVNSLAYAEGLGSSMDPDSSLRVNDVLQVEGHNNIYAMGDCTNVKEAKLVPNAENQAECTLANIKLTLQGKTLKTYKPDNIPVKITVSLGRTSGTGETKGGTILPEFVLRTAKSKDMLVPRAFKNLNQKVPKL